MNAVAVIACAILERGSQRPFGEMFFHTHPLPFEKLAMHARHRRSPRLKLVEPSFAPRGELDAAGVAVPA
jgi:hypothetical protein